MSELTLRQALDRDPEYRTTAENLMADRIDKLEAEKQSMSTLWAENRQAMGWEVTRLRKLNKTYSDRIDELEAENAELEAENERMKKELADEYMHGYKVGLDDGFSQ